MNHILASLLTLFLLLSSPATEVNGAFWQSSLAAKTEVTALTKFYPENAGFAGATERTFLMPGQVIACRSSEPESPWHPVSLRGSLPVTSSQLMNVYEVNAIGDIFRGLLLDRKTYPTDELFQKASLMLYFTGVPKGSDWKAPTMRFLNPARPEPDFWLVGMGTGAFGVHPRALETVQMFLEMAGEILPLPHKGINLAMLNITQCWDCLDQERSQWEVLRSGRRILKTPFFVPEHFQASTLFKIPERPVSIYCLEESGEAESEFKACVEENKLTGLKFELVWSDRQ